MSTTKAIIAVGTVMVLILLSIAGTMIYSAYLKGETKFVELQIKRQQEIAVLQAESQEDDRRVKCDTAWQQYKLAELHAEGLRIAGKEVAYDRAKVSLIGLRPICGPELGFQGASQLIIEQLEITEKQEEIREAIKRDNSLGFKGKVKRTLLNFP